MKRASRGTGQCGSSMVALSGKKRSRGLRAHERRLHAYNEKGVWYLGRPQTDPSHRYYGMHGPSFHVRIVLDANVVKHLV